MGEESEGKMKKYIAVKRGAWVDRLEVWLSCLLV